MMLKIALLQMNACECNIQQNILIADKFCRKAAEEGADIAVFPEMFSIGYPTPYNENNSFTYWHDVAFDGKKVDPLNHTEKLYQQAIDDNHEYVNHFRVLAKELNIAIAVTYMSKGNARPRNTVLLIDRFGNDVLKYSKTHLFAPFFIDSICEPGGEFFVKELNTQYGPVRVGALICADRNIPEPSRILMKLGAEIVIMPNACPLKGLNGIILDAAKIRAFENAFVFAICNYPEPKNDGYSAVFGPDGSEILRADSNEHICIANIDLSRLRGFRARSVEGDAFREESYYRKILGGAIHPDFSGRLNALAERPAQYNREEPQVGSFFKTCVLL